MRHRAATHCGIRKNVVLDMKGAHNLPDKVVVREAQSGNADLSIFDKTAVKEIYDTARLIESTQKRTAVYFPSIPSE